MISGYERGVNEICALLGFYAASIGSFLPTFRDNGWWLWHSHSGVDEDSSHVGRFALSTGQFTFIFRAISPILRSTETSITLRQSTGRNLHQHLCENVMSHNRRPCRAELMCKTRLLRICEDHCRIHKSPILDLFFIPCIMIYWNSG